MKVAKDSNVELANISSAALVRFSALLTYLLYRSGSSSLLDDSREEIHGYVSENK